MYICIYVCVCIYVCIYLCIYIYMERRTWSNGSIGEVLPPRLPPLSRLVLMKHGYPYPLSVVIQYKELRCAD